LSKIPSCPPYLFNRAIKRQAFRHGDEAHQPSEKVQQSPAPLKPVGDHGNLSPMREASAILDHRPDTGREFGEGDAHSG